MRNVFSVSEVNRYIKNKLSTDILLSHLFIKGEISNFVTHSSGHLYFTIKDITSNLKCVMFKGQAISLKFQPKNGMKIIAGGYISVFEKSGEYQLYVQDIQPDGLGALHIAYEQLKEKLENEGLFDKSKKKSIPILPKSIALITSPTGAAIQDMINIIKRRFPNINLIIIPVRVQGDKAAEEIANAIKIANTKISPDTIIVGRGGGSLEDLWAFNEEIVARAIYESNIPIISSVGHETDFTIADFVADLRAPTPSAAAELAVPEYSGLLNTININKQRLISGLLNQLELKKEKLNSLKNKSIFRMPLYKIKEYRQQIDMNSKLINERFLNQYKRKKETVGILIEKLSILNPINILKRGFSIAKKIDGTIIKSIKNIKKEDKINIVLNDGVLNCQVIEKKREGVDIFARKEN